MCGFSGFLGGGALGETGLAEVYLKSSANALIHRGPDDFGFWHRADQQIGLAHRRLSIVDLSPAGHQPMNSMADRFVIVFNGEIYNHLDLRKELGKRASAWRGHSDTETLLTCFDIWGIEETIKRSIGMFAFAVWDKQKRTLTLGRDRAGEKPLYYGWQGSGHNSVFLFGSELKALRTHPAFNSKLDRNALALYMRHNCIPSPYSIYQSISKLPPGCLLQVSLQQREPIIKNYWSSSSAAKTGITHQFSGSTESAVNELEMLLKDAVLKQMMADVPLGAFLSGGIDSSTVVALMQAQSSKQIKTFSIGFHEQAYDEARYSKAVAHHLGTDHTELYVTPKEAMDVIPNLPELWDEPFADSSQIPTFLVAKLARQHVKVSLSGDAGDELFCGYNRYKITAGLWQKISAIPESVRSIIAKGLTTIPISAWDKTADIFNNTIHPTKRVMNLGNKIHKGANILLSRSSNDLYRGMVSHWSDPSAVVLGAEEYPSQLTSVTSELKELNNVERMMALDLLTYLPDDILVKVDRAAMGVSLETRAPFLDHRVIEFAWQLPLSYKLREGETKWALRQVLYRYVPKHLIDRPKMGFGVPIDAWLRAPLRDWAESLLDESRLKNEGIFQPALIRQKWSEHLSGKRNWQYHLWDVLMFQSWLESFHISRVAGPQFESEELLSVAASSKLLAH